MSTEFARFTEAATRGQKPGDDASALSGATSTGETTLARVAVLGGGPDAQLLAAICLSCETSVTLFSAYGRELESLRTSSGISLRGAGPVGTYQVDRDAMPSVSTTAELDSAVADAHVIFLTGPVHKQRTYAMVLADHLSDGQIIVLAPGRSLGALETAWFLRIGGCKADVTIVETQGLPFWYKAEGSVFTLGDCAPVAAATLPSGRPHILEHLKVLLPNIEPVESVLWSGFADGSALVEMPALLLNGPAMSGGVKIPMGGTPLEENQSFAALIGAEQRAVIEALAAERHAVARLFGVRNLPSVEQWINVHAGEPRGDGRRPVPSQPEAQRLLRDGVVGSLVPLLSAGDLAGLSLPQTQSMITLASTLLGADVAAAGRRLDTIGINESDIDSARRAMDAIATGQR